MKVCCFSLFNSELGSGHKTTKNVNFFFKISSINIACRKNFHKQTCFVYSCSIFHLTPYCAVSIHVKKTKIGVSLKLVKLLKHHTHNTSKKSLAFNFGLNQTKSLYLYNTMQHINDQKKE